MKRKSLIVLATTTLVLAIFVVGWWFSGAPFQRGETACDLYCVGIGVSVCFSAAAIGIDHVTHST